MKTYEIPCKRWLGGWINLEDSVFVRWLCGGDVEAFRGYFSYMFLGIWADYKLTEDFLTNNNYERFKYIF